MLFAQNKYTNWYYSIIDNAVLKNTATDVYYEKHHIIPRSLGGTNDKSNLVKLTAREHFVCHLLLTKMTYGKAKASMCYAAWQMTNINGRDRYSPTSRIYSMLRQALAKSYKGVKKNYSSFGGKKHTLATKKKQSLMKQGSNNPMYGRTQSAETVKRIIDAQKNIAKPKFVCEKCNKIVGGKSNLVRWHGDNCKENQNY